MKPLAFAALCALLSQCHSRDSSLSRPKRTLRMLESLLGTMRDTLVGPPAAPPAAEVIFATKYPLGVKYALYPTVRMHLRPIQQHLIYMQTMPALPVMPAPASTLRSIRPPPDAAGGGGAVEILRSIPPLVQLPKTKTTTTIHYEIIPFPLPVRSDPQAERRPQHLLPPSPPPPPPPPPASVLSPPPSSPPYHSPAPSQHYEEGDGQSAPWSLDELPPPVAASEPLNLDDEADLPWNLHALPPPIATKPPRGEEGPSWQMRPAHQDADGEGEYALPVFDKKFATQQTQRHLANLRHSHLAYFRPSALHSEITIQPSVELAAYSHTHALTQQPDDEYPKPLRSLDNPKPQVFPSHSNRLRREASAAHFVQPDVDGQALDIAAQPRILSTAAFSRRGSKTAAAAAHPSWSAPSTPPPLKPFRRRPMDGHGSSDESATPADATSRPSPRRWNHYAPAPAPPHQPVTVERYVLITPRPANVSHLSSPLAMADASVGGLRLSLPQRTEARAGGSREERRQQGAGRIGSWFDESEERSRIPATGLLSKRPRHRLYPSRPSLLSRKKQPQLLPSPLSVDGFFGNERPAADGFGGGGGGIDELLRAADLDKVEYFEPIVIDVDADVEDAASDELTAKRRGNGGTGRAADVGFEFDDFDAKERNWRREPLRLPGRLHETVDQPSDAFRHPPVFDDADGDGSEPRPATAAFPVFGDESAS